MKDLVQKIWYRKGLLASWRMETHSPPSSSESTTHGDSCGGPPDHCAPSPEVRDGFHHASFLPAQPALSREEGPGQRLERPGSRWTKTARAPQAGSSPRSWVQSPALAALRAAGSWGPGARAGWYHQPSAKAGQASLPTSGASLGVPSTWASLIPALPCP